MTFRRVILALALLIAFAFLLVFISTSIEQTTTAAGEVRTVAIGFGSPWYQQISSPEAYSREINLLAPSFLSGIAGLFLIWLSLRHYQKGTPPG
jgi:hypothetical protein